jgi:hypothetical protein
VTHRRPMPLCAENRCLYLIDLQRLSGTFRFQRDGRRYEQYCRPHLRKVAHLDDGRRWDAEASYWRSDQSQRVSMTGGFALASVRMPSVLLECAHLNHNSETARRETYGRSVNVAT